MRPPYLTFLLAIALLLMASAARADDHNTNISISVHCGGGGYTTSGARSEMNDLLDHVQSFCRDQDKSNLHDDQNPAKDRNCLDYTLKNLADQDQAEQPGRACRTGNGTWQITK